MECGWISIHRKIKDHWVWDEKPFSKGQAWVDILLMANHAEKKVALGNELITVKRGMFITSEKKLMENWGWSKGKVRAFLKMLEDDLMIERKTDSKKTTINVVNYNVFQDSQTAKEPKTDQEKTGNEPHSDCERTANGLQTDTNNNDNNGNNVNNGNNDNNSYGEKPPKKQRAKIDFCSIMEYFNTNCTGFPSIREMTERRKNAVRSFLKNHTEADLYQLFTMAQESDFLTGAGNKGWRADFDWILKNHVKILEGNYRNRPTKQDATMQEYQRLMEKYADEENETTNIFEGLL